jgi:RNA polymerase sigma-70 factor (ECF subfamily)
MDPRCTRLDDSSFPRVLAGAKSGEGWAAEALFVDLQPRVLRFLRSTEGRAADDLAGEVWLAMARGIATFEGDLQAFRGWVFSIARRRVADHRRTGARRRTDPTDPAVLAVSASTDDIAEDVTERLSAQQAVDLIADVLPADQADVVLLRVLAGLDVAHVAEVLQRTPNWVRVTQHRALRRLAKHFSVESVEDVIPGWREAI